MVANPQIRVGNLQETELPEASRIMHLAFGTFLRMPNPLQFMDDRDFLGPRWHAPHVQIIAARDGGRLIGTNAITRWGSFGFFGPLTVLPDYWNRGVAQRLLESTMKVFAGWGVRQTGLFTFPNSALHIGLYQKFGYWPGYLTAVMTRTPEGGPEPRGDPSPVLLSALDKPAREQAIAACRRISGAIARGLDLSDEIRAVLKQRTGDIVMTYARATPEAFAVCLNGPGSEGGEKICYVKFGAARGGAGAGDRFDRLLGACDAFARSRNAKIEAGVNMARVDVYQRMAARGYKVMILGVAMQQPHAEGFNRADCFVMDDWR